MPQPIGNSKDYYARTAQERVDAILSIISDMRSVTSINHNLVFTHNDPSYADAVPPIHDEDWDHALMAVEDHMWALFPQAECSAPEHPCPHCQQAWCTHSPEDGSCPQGVDRCAVQMP